MQNDTSELDQMQTAYKVAVEEWIAAIRREEALASVNHSIAEAIREAALKPEKVLVQRERGLLPERRRSVGLATIVDMIVGPNVRFLIGAALLAGCRRSVGRVVDGAN